MQLERSGIALSELSVCRSAEEVPTTADIRWHVIMMSIDGTAGQGDLALARNHFPDSSIIAVSSKGSLSRAVDIMRLGADDFLIRPISAPQLLEAVTAAARRVGSPAREDDPGGAHDDRQKLIGSSSAVKTMFETLQRAAGSKATVFLKGESGTGKELCAQAVHDLSPRADGPLISINCSAIPRELMESEIFGHEKGAFTGAAHMRQGAAELADGGTLFLDEICEMDLLLQAKLLRFVQTGQFTRVGGSTLKTVDVRFVCATNKDPMKAVHTGAFRADLFYRLHVLPVVLPPLRERGTDVLDIARHALAQFSAEEGKSFRHLDSQVEALLQNYWWPGNVRELLNVIRNVVVMNDGETVTPDMIPLAFAHSAEPRSGSAASTCAPESALSENTPSTDVLRPLWQHEQDIIERAIAACDGNVGVAAAHLGINPSTIYRKRHSWAQQVVA